MYGSFTSASKSVLEGDLFYGTLHTSKAYGFTYLQFGTVSMFTFAKYCLLYGEALMFIFRWEVNYH